MEESKIHQSSKERKISFRLIGSYAFDWLILAGLAAVGYVLGHITPNKRPFFLTDTNISLPFAVRETVPPFLLLIANTIIPGVVVFVVALVFVPGSTVPKGTPKSLVWKRKLWELHVGWLGLALALVSAWFITSGMKNLFGKPRPDLLSRCVPDLDNIARHIVGGNVSAATDGRLVSASICTNKDKVVLDDGFRSFPSGHASSSAAGLIYLSLFLASKFAVTIPFLARGTESNDHSAFSAFPSRLAAHLHQGNTLAPEEEDIAPSPTCAKAVDVHVKVVTAARRQAAAPPLYLLVLTVLPSFGAIFIASSRWFDFRHHGFDILFGFTIGLVTAVFAFRYYHLPICSGAGWAWAPRSKDKAFWAGVGSYSYATSRPVRAGDEEEVIRGRDDGTTRAAEQFRSRGTNSTVVSYT